MIFDETKSNFWCNECKKWISIDPCDYLIIYNSVQCMNLHHCGFEWDLFPCDYYYLYHNKGQCRCVQDKTNCFGKEDDCNYINGRKSYEND